jgi:Domain of unknown function (DUF6471)
MRNGTYRQKEWGIRASRFPKAELKRAGVGYKDLPDRPNEHGMEETETSKTGKLARHFRRVILPAR